MNKRIEDIIAETRLNEILHKNEAEKQKNTVIWTLAIIGAVAAVAAIAYAVYRFVSPDYLDDFEDISLAVKALQDPADPILDWETAKHDLLRQH